MWLCAHHLDNQGHWRSKLKDVLDNHSNPMVCLAFTTSCMTLIFLGLFHWFLHALEAMELDYVDINLELTRAYLNTMYMRGKGRPKEGRKKNLLRLLLDS